MQLRCTEDTNFMPVQATPFFGGGELEGRKEKKKATILRTSNCHGHYIFLPRAKHGTENINRRAANDGAAVG